MYLFIIISSFILVGIMEPILRSVGTGIHPGMEYLSIAGHTHLVLEKLLRVGIHPNRWEETWMKPT